MTSYSADNPQNSSGAPLTVDDLVVFDNDHEVVAPSKITEFQDVTLPISSLSDRPVDSPKILQGSSKTEWTLSLPRGLVVGQPGANIDSLDLEESKDNVDQDLEPNLSAWGGVTYHPKISGPMPGRSMRRASGSLTSPDYVIGDTDERQVYYPSGYPWNCIGLLRVWTDPTQLNPAKTGTAALVGRNVVLTARHMVPWGGGDWMIQFIPAYYDGGSLYGAGASSYCELRRRVYSVGQAHDMAVLKLYEPLGDTFGYFGYKRWDSDWEDGDYWTRSGYPTAVAMGQRPSRQTFFPVHDTDNFAPGMGSWPPIASEIEYKADSSGGDSGGPLFGWWGDPPLPYVVGTHSGGEKEWDFPFGTNKHNVSAGGPALSYLIGWARKNW